MHECKRSADNAVAAVLTAKGRIAAATYRITLSHAGYSLYFTMGRDMSLKFSLSWGRLRPHPIHGSLGPHESTPKRTVSWPVEPF